MSSDPVTFAELVRRAQAAEPPPSEVAFYQLCPLCDRDARWVLVGEVANDEIYRSECCGAERVYRVR